MDGKIRQALMKLARMKMLKLNRRETRAFRGKSRGFTLVEVVIAMGLLGIIGVAVLTALSYASTMLIVADRRATAESLAKTQMEYVKSQDYVPAPNGGAGNYSKIADIPAGYTIWSVNRTGPPVDTVVIGVPWDSEANNATYEDTGLQKITVIVNYTVLRYNTTSQGSTFMQKNFTLEDYKRDPEA